MSIVPVILIPFFSSLQRFQRTLNQALFEAAVILAAVALGRDVRSVAQIVSHLPLPEDTSSTGSIDSKSSTGKSGSHSGSTPRADSPKTQVLRVLHVEIIYMLK